MRELGVASSECRATVRHDLGPVFPIFTLSTPPKSPSAAASSPGPRIRKPHSRYHGAGTLILSTTSGVSEEHTGKGMTSEKARRSSHTKAPSRASSSANSIQTPSSGSASSSPTSNMSVRIADLRDDLEDAQLDGAAKGLKARPRSQLNRKASSPMMPAFVVSAPGKVIVFGEHAVVHGKVCGH